jgi:hypothetical protein
MDRAAERHGRLAERVAGRDRVVEWIAHGLLAVMR